MTRPEFFPGILKLSEKLRETISQNSMVFFLADDNTSRFCLTPLIASSEHWPQYHIIETEAGERCKHIDVFANVSRTLLHEGADRNAVLVNVGGGCITDLGGFVASTYLRGISFIHIPTSLLAMTDASVGGKTGIDLDEIKNAIGTISSPSAVMVCPSFLETLPVDQLRCGLAEMLKHGLISDRQLWHDLKKINPDDHRSLALYIQKSIDIKLEIVESDLKEKGLRKLLNFGHTIGHALETAALKKGQLLYHGDAIAAGMIVESHLSFQKKMLNKEDLDDILMHLTPNFDKILKNFAFDEILPWMYHDKKREGNKLLFAFPDRIGHAVYDIACDEEECRDAYRTALG